MKTAFIIFNQMTALDFIGIYDPLTRLKSMKFMPEFDWDICAFSTTVFDDRGLKFFPDSIASSLSDYDMVILPGGFGTRDLQHNEAFLEWIKSAESVNTIASVCTGSLLLGAAGFLTGKVATTHPAALDELEPYCKQVSTKRICDEGGIITAGGVTSAIDLGLYLAEMITNKETQEKIAQQIHYPYF